MKDHTDQAMLSAKRLRREMSLPEVLLWNRLRGKPMGVKFRNQHPVGEYVIDFYHAPKRIGFEIDGIVHDMGDRPQRDQSRDAKLAELGVEVVRMPASDVLKDADAVAESIVRYCLNRPPPSGLRPATSLKGGGLNGVAH
jgi:very-short-patch-repair endonuclease